MRRLPVLLLLAILAAVPTAAAAPGDERSSASTTLVTKPGKKQLQRQRLARKLRPRAFNSCPQLVRYARRHAAHSEGISAGPPPLMPPIAQPPLLRSAPGQGPLRTDVMAAPPTAAPETSSQTNVQEAGVNEPDVVKTAGDRIFALAGGKLHAVDAAGPTLLGTLATEGYAYQLLLHEDRALVIGYEQDLRVRPASVPIAPLAMKTVLTEVDVSDPAAMRVVSRQTIDGTYVDARQSGETARVVISSPPRAIAKPATAFRRGGWVPTSIVKSRPGARAVKRPLASCRRIARPASFSGTSVLTVLTIDLSKGLPAVDVDALMTDGQTVYASPNRLYVATPRWLPSEPDSAQPPPRATTTVHSFDASQPGVTSYRASGQVPGHLLNQFSLSEHDDALRVASTEEPSWWGFGDVGESESFVTVLSERGGALMEVGRVGGIGRGERIYAVRFVGDVGFVVTFRQTDPLYTIDLADPTRPRVAGELKIPGYSAYLHPIDADTLIGVGQDANDRGSTRGTQISIFDVSDLRQPRRLHHWTIEDSTSAVEEDHHAFLWWAPTKLAVLPVQDYDYDGFNGAIGFQIDRRTGIGEAGRASHELPDYFPSPVERAFVVGGRLFTLSELGIQANDLGTLAQQGWAAFPQDPVAP